MTRVAILGTPCGGTRYLADCLRAGGLRVGHEKLEPDGIVCGWTAIRDLHGLEGKRSWSLSTEDWDTVGIVVRHPLLVAQTLPWFLRHREHYPWHHRHPVLFALRTWVEMHEASLELLVPEVEFTLEDGQLAQLEFPCGRVRADANFDADFAILADRLGIDPEARPKTGPLSKPRRWEVLGWAWWERRDPDYAERARCLLSIFELDEPELQPEREGPTMEDTGC